jgi:SAM-dependent methyltransferase
MSTYIWVLMVLLGGLFGLKIAYVLGTSLVLPITQGALYVSTSRQRIAAFLRAVPMKEGQLIVDLGCGDGRVLRRARKQYGVKAIGYEMNPLAYLKAQILCLGHKGIEVRHYDFWKVDLSDADVVFCYLFPDVMRKLSLKLRSELRPGTTVVSCNFAVPGFAPEQVLRPIGSLHNDPIYIYHVNKVSECSFSAGGVSGDGSAINGNADARQLKREKR